MKIRQALKLYNKSKHTLLKIRTIEDDGMILGRNTRSFKQWRMCTGQRDRIIDKNGNGAWFSIGDIWDKGYLDSENKYHKTLC